MSIDLGAHADEVFASFAQKLAKCLENQEFDVLAAGGDSGAVMVEFAKFVYEALDMTVPPVVLLPVFRPSKSTGKELSLQDETLADMTRRQLGSIKPNRILFLDDEIGEGNTLSICLKAIMSAHPEGQVSCTLLAEDDGFDVSGFRLRNVTLNFIPFSRHVDDVYSAIFWFTPYELEKPVKAAIQALSLGDGSDHDKWPMNILLGASLKLRADGRPYFSHEIEQRIALTNPSLRDMQSQFRRFVRDKVQMALEHDEPA